MVSLSCLQAHAVQLRTIYGRFDTHGISHAYAEVSLSICYCSKPVISSLPLKMLVSSKSPFTAMAAIFLHRTRYAVTCSRIA